MGGGGAAWASGSPGPAAAPLTPGWAPPWHSCCAHSLSSPGRPCSLELFTSQTSSFHSSELLSGSSWTPPGGLAFETLAVKPLRPSPGPGEEGGCSPHSAASLTDESPKIARHVGTLAFPGCWLVLPLGPTAGKASPSPAFGELICTLRGPSPRSLPLGSPSKSLRPA